MISKKSYVKWFVRIRTIILVVLSLYTIAKIIEEQQEQQYEIMKLKLKTMELEEKIKKLDSKTKILNWLE